MTDPVLSRLRPYAFTGPRYVGKTRLHNACKSELPKRFRELTFAFLESPFEKLPFPLLAGLQQDEEPTTVLWKLWGDLNEFTKKKLKRVLEQEPRVDVVFMDDFGIRALIHALTCTGSGFTKEDYKETTELHHEFVQVRLRRLGLRPPMYFNLDTADQNAIRCIHQKVPGAKRLVVDAVAELIALEAQITRDYFGPDTGQECQHLNVDTCSDTELITIIGDQIETDRVKRSMAA